MTGVQTCALPICQVVWYSHVFQNFPQFIAIHIVKGFGLANKAEIDVFLELSCFFNDPADVGNKYGGGLVAKSCPNLVTPWIVACQAPLSMGFSRQ